MENKIYNDDVERIVNDPERQEAIKKNYRKKRIIYRERLLTKAIVFAILSLIFGFVTGSDLMTPWISLPSFMICGMTASYSFGRWLENVRFWGWK